MSGIVERLRDLYELWGLGSKGPGILIEAADRIEELERQLAEAREASQNLHRRAQAAEGRLQRMEAAHEEACRIAFTKSIDYHLYASILLNCNRGLFPKLVNKGAVVTDGAAFIRNQALEEAAKVIEEGFDRGIKRKSDTCAHGKFEWEDCESCAASAIRALSDSSPSDSRNKS